MSRYFFHVQDGTTYPDTEGTELPTLQAARRHAARYAGQLLQDLPDAFWSGAQWQMTVTDARGLTLFCLIFTGIDAPALG